MWRPVLFVLSSNNNIQIASIDILHLLHYYKLTPWFFMTSDFGYIRSDGPMSAVDDLIHLCIWFSDRMQVFIWFQIIIPIPNHMPSY